MRQQHRSETRRRPSAKFFYPSCLEKTVPSLTSRWLTCLNGAL
jgi:hypothetical protein